jgi:hypothetical protein
VQPKTRSEISSLAYAPERNESLDSRALETSVYHHLLVCNFLGGTFSLFRTGDHWEGAGTLLFCTNAHSLYWGKRVNEWVGAGQRNLR